jgi:resolvase-like protein
MRAACYARYSSDLQRETSIDDQLATARRYAQEQRWTILKDHIYKDSAVSGASIQGRAGVQRLLAAAAHRPKPFDAVGGRLRGSVATLSEGSCTSSYPMIEYTIKITLNRWNIGYNEGR